MASILESLTGLIGPSMGPLAKALGLDEDLVKKGLGVAGPLVLSQLNRAAASGRAGDLINALPKGDGAFGGIGDLIGMATGGRRADSTHSVMGPGVNAMSAQLSKALGFNVAPLIGIAGPMIMGVLGKSVKEQKLDAGGLATLIGDQFKAFRADPTQTDIVALVDRAGETGDAAAAKIAGWGPDWERVLRGPPAALVLVMGANISSPMGTARELDAGGRSLAEAAGAGAPDSVLAMAFAGGIPMESLKSLNDGAKTREALLAVVKDSAAAVAARAPAEAAGFKAALLQAAEAAAGAVKDGGVFGIGGKPVSDKEQSALDAIKAALA